jgi:hypothetical protein
MSSIDPALEAVFVEQINQQNEAEQAQRDNQQNVAREIDQRRAELLRSLTTTNKKVQYDPRIIQIANALQTQPALIPPMELFLTRLVKSISEAVQDAINKVAGPDTTG